MQKVQLLDFINSEKTTRLNGKGVKNYTKELLKMSNLTKSEEFKKLTNYEKLKFIKKFKESYAIISKKIN